MFSRKFSKPYQKLEPIIRAWYANFTAETSSIKLPKQGTGKMSQNSFKQTFKFRKTAVYF